MRRDLVEWLVMAGAVLIAAQTAAAQSMVELGATQATASALAGTAAPSAATTLGSVRDKVAALPPPVDPDHLPGFGGKPAAHTSKPGGGWGRAGDHGSGKRGWSTGRAQSGAGWARGRPGGPGAKGWATGRGTSSSGWARAGSPRAMAHPHPTAHPGPVAHR
jgi:hypothetical protein